MHAHTNIDIFDTHFCKSVYTCIDLLLTKHRTKETTVRTQVAYTHTQICIHTYSLVHTYTSIYTLTYIHAYICMYMYAYVQKTKML